MHGITKDELEGDDVMLAQGEFDLAQTELDSVTVPTTSPESMQLAGMLALFRSFVAAADSRTGDVVWCLRYNTGSRQSIRRHFVFGGKLYSH